MRCARGWKHAMSDALLRVKDLSVTYGNRRVVDSISFDLAAGRCLGVIGESGAGKSQAFLGMLGLAEPDARVDGSARLGDEELCGGGAVRVRGRRVAMIFQDPATSLTPHLRIGEQIAEPLRLHRRMARDAALSMAGSLLEQVQVDDPVRRLRQYPHELSGGMRQRVMIAMALACDPQLLVADEPTTALDVSVQAQLLKLLRRLMVERRLALVVVTHDMGVVAALADEVAVMQAGRIVEQGPVDRVLASPQHEYTRALLRATPRMDSPAPATFATDSALTVHQVAVHHRVRAPWFGRHQPLRAVDGVSFEVGAGEALGIVGESGCGKSTLARALLRLHDVDRGRIVWLGRELQDLHGEEMRALRAGLQLVFQDPVASLDPTQTVAEIVDEPLRALAPGVGAAERKNRVAAMLARVGLSGDYARRRSRELSGGQCQRVAIARAMILEPKLLVCDEAVSSLDVSIQAQIVALLADIKRERGTSIIFVSHNLAVVRQLCERVLVMYLGRVVECGPTDRVLASPAHPYTRLLLDSVPRLEPAVERARLDALSVPGEMPSALDRPTGCAFRTRCPQAQPTCASASPETERIAIGHEVACLRWRDIVKTG
jgi:peptide/nickel transport system ATP-binding protein